MIESKPIEHHIRWNHEPIRLCDEQPAASSDILIGDMGSLRKARGEAVLCPTCQQNSGHQPFSLRPSHEDHGKRALAHLYTVPVRNAFDDIRNCPHCRENPGKRTCRAWRDLARSVRVLQQEASLTAREVTELWVRPEAGRRPCTGSWTALWATWRRTRRRGRKRTRSPAGPRTGRSASWERGVSLRRGPRKRRRKCLESLFQQCALSTIGEHVWTIVNNQEREC